MGAGDDGETGEEGSQPGGEARRPGARGLYQNLAESCRCRQVLTDASVNLPAIGDGMHGTPWPNLHNLRFTPHSEAVA